MIDAEFVDLLSDKKDLMKMFMDNLITGSVTKLELLTTIKKYLSEELRSEDVEHYNPGNYADFYYEARILADQAITRNQKLRKGMAKIDARIRELSGVATR